ncbi:MAG: hypothetical protein QOI12_2451 [Alphaproteobacteria bacterium]|jgi:hypothetical protein|nr:hypothetical protein [Alphaproteobacteria bacterium]
MTALSTIKTLAGIATALTVVTVGAVMAEAKTVFRPHYQVSTSGPANNRGPSINVSKAVVRDHRTLSNGQKCGTRGIVCKN